MSTTDPSQVNEELVIGTPAGDSSAWNWHPDIPIRYSPLFERPLKPGAVVKWFVHAWLPFTELTCYLLLAIVVWQWLQPPLAQTTALEVGWVSAVWARNVIMMTLIAAGLHLWLYTWRKQGDSYRYMRRSPTENHKKFLGGRQLTDNMFYVLASGVTIWTLYEVMLWLAFANGVSPVVSFAENPVWFVLWFPLIGIWYSFHFYWVHRFLHWKPMYDHVHAVHHRNVTTGPWSGFSMHPVEHLLYLSSLFIHLVVPSHPIHMLFHAYWLTLATATSHSGYEALVVGTSTRTTISTFFHAMHHRYFTCNYGNVELPMDRWFGSFNDGTSAETRRLQARWIEQRKSDGSQK
ncbi:MAG: desaturase [Thiotrichales bacterium]|nr:desaturase [Thiotrichales bacterium]|tara:strand:- start:170 stop:1213 length:1044 start_codon:yes stop_codon:yes gene_type:complete